MELITNLVPIRIDASSSDGAVRIIDTLLMDTTCLPISHGYPRHDGVSGLNSFAGETEATDPTLFSLSSLINANASHLTESILSDAEVYGSVRSSSKTFMGGRLDLLSDTKLYLQIEKQIRRQLEIALTTEKTALIPACGFIRHEAAGIANSPDIAMSSNGIGKADQVVSPEMLVNESRIVRIKIRLRHENIVVVDEFDYDVNSSGIEGFDPFSIANSLVQDMKLPAELAPSIATTIVEQIYGVNVTDSRDGLTLSASARHAPTALVLDSTKEGTMSDFAQIMMSK